MNVLDRIATIRAEIERSRNVTRAHELVQSSLMVEARREGHSLAEIGQAAGVTPQRVHQLTATMN